MSSSMSRVSAVDQRHQRCDKTDLAPSGSEVTETKRDGGSPAVQERRQDDTKTWTTRTMIEAVEDLLPLTVMSGLIFGGCCSNVFALETIVKEEPASGLLITFVQFIITALFTWPSHFAADRPPFFVKDRAVPLIRWLPNILMFFAVNMLNNFAFGYNISIPVHIILRSGGSVMTMAVGYSWGKSYSKVQVFSVAMLTIGILMAAMGDAKAKGKTDTNSATRIDFEFVTGLTILFVAQLLSAFMGLYTQLTYDKYGSHWHENLFYSHALSIPLFMFFSPSLLSQFRKLLTSTPIQLNSNSIFSVPEIYNRTAKNGLSPVLALLSSLDIRIPKHILTLTLNALTQYACIRGVNLLGARTSALGVSIVLNVRKLVSLFLSIWLFGNKLPPGVVAGAAVVFGSAGIWAWEGQRLGERRRVNKETEKRK